jgi:phosphoglycolate phosphatase-like HAD superfamily hydrolase
MGGDQLVSAVAGARFEEEHGDDVRAAWAAEFLKLFDGRRLADAWTNSEDVDRTKPEPDLISVAVERVGGTDAVVIGDSVWDFIAAGKAGHVGYAIRSGGFSDAELRDADARDVFDSVVELCGALDRVLA